MSAERNAAKEVEAGLPATTSVVADEEHLPSVLSAVLAEGDWEPTLRWELKLRWRERDVGMEIMDGLLDDQSEFRDKFHRRLSALVSPDDPHEKGLSLPLADDEVWREYAEAIRQKGGHGSLRTAQEAEAMQMLEDWLAAFPEKLAAERMRPNDPMRSLHREVERFVFLMVLEHVIPGHIDEYTVLLRVSRATRLLSNSRIYRDKASGEMRTLPAHEFIDMNKKISDAANRAHREHEKEAARSFIRRGRRDAEQAETAKPEFASPKAQLLEVWHDPDKPNMRRVTTQHGMVVVPRKTLAGFDKFNDACEAQLGVRYEKPRWQTWNRMVDEATNRSLQLEFSTKTADGVVVADFADREDGD